MVQNVNRFNRTRQDHRQEIAEDYCEMIYQWVEADKVPRAVDLAETMGVSQVSASKTLKRLRDAGLVTFEPYRCVALTESGVQLARASMRRHQLVVGLLLRLGVAPDVAETDAEGIEHHVSDATLSAIERFLD